MVVVADFEFLFLRFVGVAVHGVTHEQEVEVVLKFQIDQMLEFRTDTMSPHSNDYEQLSLLIQGV